LLVLVSIVLIGYTKVHAHYLLAKYLVLNFLNLTELTEDKPDADTIAVAVAEFTMRTIEALGEHKPRDV